jgi:hypothetical protein
MDFGKIINTGLTNIGYVVGSKLSVNGIMKCNNPDNLLKLTQGASSFATAKLILNYVVVLFLLLLNNLVNLGGTMFAVIFMLVLFLISIGVYFYYNNDYNSKKDTINKCLTDNYGNTPIM